MNPTIETYSGRLFDLLDPQPEQFEIEDIAHALSQVCRFSGHCRYFYSVAQHCYLGSFVVPAEDALWFLLHDATEAFLGDMSKPLKHCTDIGAAYRPVEGRLMEVICRKFGLPVEQPRSIRQVDVGMLYAEKLQLMGTAEWSISWFEGQQPAPVVIAELSCREVEQMYLNRFRELKENR